MAEVSSEERAFRRAVVVGGDATARLVYADWLADQGRPVEEACWRWAVAKGRDPIRPADPRWAGSMVNRFTGPWVSAYNWFGSENFRTGTAQLPPWINGRFGVNRRYGIWHHSRTRWPLWAALLELWAEWDEVGEIHRLHEWNPPPDTRLKGN